MSINSCTLNKQTVDAFCSDPRAGLLNLSTPRRALILDRLIRQLRQPATGGSGGGTSSSTIGIQRIPVYIDREIQVPQPPEFIDPVLKIDVTFKDATGSVLFDTSKDKDDTFVAVSGLDITDDEENISVEVSGFEIEVEIEEPLDDQEDIIVQVLDFTIED